MPLHQKIFLLLVLLLPIQLGWHFWPPFSYVFGLRVDYLSPTIYLTDILVILILFFWLLDSLQVTGLRIAGCGGQKHWWILAFFVFLLFNCLLSQNQGVAFYKLAKIIEFTLLGFYVARNNYILRITYRVLPLAVIYSSFLAIAQFFKQSSLGGIFWWLGERTFNIGTPGIAKAEIGGRLLMRPYATFPHPNALAGFILVSLILTLPFLFKKHKLFTISYLLLAIFTLLLTFSRSVWLVALVICLFLLKNLPSKKLRVVGYLLVILLLSLLVNKVFDFSSESFSQRWELNKISLQLIKKNPLLGVGLNNFITCLPEFWRHTILWLQPVHNIYLLVAAETGIVGLLIFLYFLFLAYRRLFTIHYSLFIGLTVILLLGFFDHYWLTLQQTQLLFTIVLGLTWNSLFEVGKDGKN